MAQEIELRLAKLDDAERIALMSRTLIEAGLPWSWDTLRVASAIRCHDTVVLTARAKRQLVGFAIMHFLYDSAHLNLLAVDPAYQRRGLGRRLMMWLEESARVAGTFVVSLELRTRNHGARAFYRKLGYAEIVRIPGYYCRREAALRMTRDVRRHLANAKERKDRAS